MMKNILFKLLIGVLILSACSKENSHSQKITFNQLFSLKEKVEIQSDSVFSIQQMIPRDSVFYLLDNESQNIFKVNRQGKITNRWGGYGKGPGEFIDPLWIGSGIKNSLFVIDAGNNRVSIFSTKWDFK